MLIKLEQFFNKIYNFIGHVTGVIMVLMMINIFYDVVMRYYFSGSTNAIQEMEWHLFAALFLFGISYTLGKDGHVRVDVFYDKLNFKKKAIINIVGTIAFLIPFALLIGFGSIEFVNESLSTMETSEDPGGLTHRWIIKAVIPISMLVLVLASIGSIVKNINLYRGTSKPSNKKDEALV